MPDQEIANLLVRSRACEIKGLEQLLITSHMIGSVSNLIHALQRERGASNLYLTSLGRCYAARILDYRSQVADAECMVRTRLEEWLALPWPHLSASRFYAHAALILHALACLPALRERIEGFDINALDAMSQFNELIRRLLTLVFEAIDPIIEPSISSAVVALLNFMQGKELAGQERAIGVTGFSQGWHDADLRTALLNRIDAQERCFQIFSEIADPDALTHWQQLLASSPSTELERARRLALSASGHQPANFEMAQLWFEHATLRIDALKAIEDGLEQTLYARCQQRIQQARAAWTAESPPPAGSMTKGEDTLPKGVLLGRPVDAADADVLLNLAREQAEGHPIAMGRPLIELVQHQSRRLQSMEDELKTAREALNERKLLEQAKTLLIKHRNMSEDEAHRMLRKTAMDQGKRLIDVARAVIAMADLLGSRF